jgi:hypothetical protein
MEVKYHHQVLSPFILSCDKNRHTYNERHKGRSICAFIKWPVYSTMRIVKGQGPSLKAPAGKPVGEKLPYGKN